MSTNYSPTIVTDGAAFVVDALMPSTATSATKLYDRVGGNNGTMYGGTCLDFDGTDDYVSGASSLWSANGDQTFACWLKVDNISNSRLIFDTSGTGDFSVQTDGQIRVHPVAGNWADTTSSISTGVWYHIVLTQTSTARKIYVDGVEQTLAVGGGSPQTVAWNSPTSALRIGHAGAYRDEFDGQMADARIYSAALSAANVKEIYNDSKVILPSNVAQTNLKCWLPMVDGAGTIAYDGSGNGNDGTLTNMTSADWLTGQTGPPQLVEGYNRPMWFSSAGSDYVQVASDGSSTFANQSFTVAGWINLPDTTPSAEGTLFSYDYTSHVSPYYSIQIRIDVSCRMYFIWNDGTTHVAIYKDSAFTENTWHHYACTFTSGSQKIYIDGVAVASDTKADTITYYNQEVWIGKSNYGGYWDGLINETVVYNSALTLAQVQVLAATGPNGGPLPPDPMSLSNSSNVVGYWRNDGNVTWTDRSGNGNTGTVYGSPDALLFKQGINGSANTSTGRDNQGFPLKFKNVGAIGFNGSSDYIQPDQSLSGPLVSTTGALDFWINFVDSDSNRGLYYLYDAAYADYFILRGGGSGNLTILAESGNSSILSNDTDLSSYMGQWINLVYTQDGTTIRVYVNGVEIDSVASTVWTGHLSTTPVCKIGYSVWASNYLNAALASVRVYNRALSYAEIQQNYNAQKSRFT